MTRTPVAELPRVTAVIPCRNEADFIATCLDSVLALDYPTDRLEVLVCDGESSDGTADLVRTYAEKHPHIRLLENPKRSLAAGWNLGVRSGAGEVFCAMIAHQTYRADYISSSVRYLREYDADGVGGVLRTLPQQDTAMGRAIAAAWANPFGVGNARFRTGTSKPVWVDNVHCGVFRRSAFDLVGGYNEDLARSQDADFQTRLKARGGRILLVPDTFSAYFTRSQFGSFAKFCVVNGYWVVRPLVHGALIKSFRHWVPLLFVLMLAVLGSTSFLFTLARWALVFVVGIYLAAAFAVAAKVAFARRDIVYLALMPLVFATLHMGYGIGSLRAALELPAARMRRSHPTTERAGHA